MLGYQKIRHLRSFLIEIMLRTFKFTKEGEDLIGDEFSYATTKERGGKPPYYRARLREKDLVFNNVEVELKDNVDNDIFNKDFLLTTIPSIAERFVNGIWKFER